MNVLRSVQEVVDAFGGTKATAEWAGHGESAVSNWIARGFIPPGWHFRMQDELSARGFVISRSVFGEVDEPPIVRRKLRQPRAETAA